MPCVVSITNDHDHDDTDKIELFVPKPDRKVLSLLTGIDYIFQNTKKKRAKHLEYARNNLPPFLLADFLIGCSKQRLN